MNAIGPRYLTDIAQDEHASTRTGVIIIGAGIAGLFAAIKASEQEHVIIITKKTLLDSNTQYAQGGIAAVVSADDSPAVHRQDTLLAGAGLCDVDAVDVLVHEGPQRVEELMRLGTQFDMKNGELSLTKEGAHSQRRILHAQGDATGAEIVRALSEQVLANENIQVLEDHFVIDVLTHEGECFGVLVQKPDGQREFIHAKATILCTGGAGQLYRHTTNPDIATGDGVAMAYRAGAVIKDVEFIQFHPTALSYPAEPRFLISEALRGEGAVLRNVKGERFMAQYDPLQELAPRDIVARAIVMEMEKTRSPHVYIDMTHQDAAQIKQRFPTIYEQCFKFGLDMATDWIPVAPAAHYMMGGVATDLYGETSVSRLFACGETSATGVHGANRLASNSLSEAVVFGQRIVERLQQLTPLSSSIDWACHEGKRAPYAQPLGNKRLRLQLIMQRYFGLKRTYHRMRRGHSKLLQYMTIYSETLTEREQFEFANMLTCAMLVARSAMAREESRGAHYREDYAHRDDVHWRQHTIIQRAKGWDKEAVHDA